ncbi:LOW QUALITY PROTEIN: solute carrier family 52, riboflavin transporter, member 3-A-like [Amphiura filiformis]|uniref:LOW QUALITY PROTEIN: solute carrier family 52, riboflavin transporter, member 3-A-like n=1 Tax=Amphiura filiformis TaxID=82378 RepID=UPI003B22835A
MASEAVKDFFKRLPVMFLVVVFGTGSWVAINGMWVELPLLVALGIPEGFNLASQLVIIIQVANIGPLTFTLANWWAPKGLKIEVQTICLVMVIGIASTLMMVFFWDVTSVWNIGNNIRSTALLCLAFFLSIVDCTSSVAFTPFMARFKHMYLTWYFVGEGFSALLPSLVALGQGVGGDICVADNTYKEVREIGNEIYVVNCTSWMRQAKPANFPPEDFFWFLFCMMSCSAIAFVLLNVLPIAKREYIRAELVQGIKSSNSGSGVENHGMQERSKGMTGNHGTIDNISDTPQNEVVSSQEEELIPTPSGLSKLQYAYLFIILGFVNALSNGILPSIQSFSAGAYGLNTYLLAATLANVANPVACFIVMAAPSMSRLLVGVMTFLGTFAGSYCLATAAMSPTPPLQQEMTGSVLIVLAWICVSGIFSYTKATIGWILRNQPDNRVLLIWFGGVTQLGSLVGAVIMFPLVNTLYLFEGYYEDACADYADNMYVSCDGVMPTTVTA